MIKLEQVSKVFALEAGNFTALKQTDISIKKGEFIAIMGPSGSGKSTLLQLLGGLDLPSTGSLIVDGVKLNQLNEKERTLFRRTKVGFVFQNYQLLPMMTVAENVALSLEANKTPKSEMKARVLRLLRDVHMEDKASHFPSQLSGGQQQRVAIARALAMKPALILADEPTGNLDRQNGEAVLQLLSRLNKDEQITVVMVTHDPHAAKTADRIIMLRDEKSFNRVRTKKEGFRMKLWQFAWRNLMRRKLRTFLTVLSVIIGVASTFAVISAVDTAKKAFPLYLKAAFGKADYNFNGTDAYFAQDVHNEIEKLNHIAASIAVLKQSTKLQLERDGISAIQKRVDLTGYSRMDTPITGFKLVDGTLNGDGAVITDRTADVWQTGVGDTISFDTEDGLRTIPITGVVKYTGELMAPGGWSMAKYHPWSVAVPLSVLQEWFGLQGKIQNVQIKSAPQADRTAFEQQAEDLVKRNGTVYLQPVIIDFDSLKEADTFFMALYIAGFLGIALSAFILFNSLYVSIKERKNEFAALKTIGYTPEQLRAFVLFEVILLSIIGTAVGLLLGFGLAAGLKALIFLVFGITSDEGMELAKGLTISLAAGLLIPVAAALYPIRQAGKVSVIEALKENRTEKASLNISRGIVGVALIVTAFFIKHLLLIVPLMLGIVLIYPYLFKLFVSLLNPVYRLLFGFGGQIAGRNRNRNLSRTSMTSVILCLGIAMIVLMGSLNSALIQSFERIIYASYGGNLDIHLHHIEKTDIESLKKLDGVADAQTYPLYSAVWMLNDQKRKLPVYGVGETWIDRFQLFIAADQKHSDMIKRLKSNELILDKTAFRVWGGKIGDTIELTTLQGPQPFKVTAVVDTMKNGGYGAFMKDDAFRDSFGIKYEQNALVLKEPDASPIQLRETIFNQFGERIMEMFGPEDWVTVIGAAYTGSFSIVNALVVLAIIISGIGITNTLLINIMERVRELGMMRAVGVSRRQVIGMVLLEGFGIGLAATVIGCAFGIVLIYMTSTFFELNSLTYDFGISWWIVSLIGLFGILISLISSFTPASRAAKTKLSEALRYE